MGDLAVHVAKTAVRRAPEIAVVPEIRDIITNMGNCADAASWPRGVGPASTPPNSADGTNAMPTTPSTPAVASSTSSPANLIRYAPECCLASVLQWCSSVRLPPHCRCPGFAGGIVGGRCRPTDPLPA